MALNLTKVAFGCASIDHLVGRWAARGEPYALGTRYLPKRHAEIGGTGSLYWIIKHQLVARSPILGFAEQEGGRTGIILDQQLVLVRAQPRRAHQGWRYLEAADAPPDLAAAGGEAVAAMPPALVGKLVELALL